MVYGFWRKEDTQNPTHELAGEGGMDRCEKRAWAIILAVFVLFMIGLITVSFWGGPYESDSFWRQEAPPTYPN